MPKILDLAVAELDLRSPAVVQTRLANEVSLGKFGYTGSLQEYICAVAKWEETCFDWRVSPDAILPVPGALSGIKAAIRALTSDGDTILVQPPVYGAFFRSDVTQGRKLLAAPLRFDGDNYYFDLDVFSSALRKNVRLLLLCNPQNPVGLVWALSDLIEIIRLCEQHGVAIISDEIHRDLIWDKNSAHVVLANIAGGYAERIVTCTSASTAFNLSGLQCANLFIADRRLREQTSMQLRLFGSLSVNRMGIVATQAAYEEGAAWLNELLELVRGNIAYFSEEVAASRLGLDVIRAGALLVSWINCHGLGMSGDTIKDYFYHELGLKIETGSKFGEAGDGFIRINLGCHRDKVAEVPQRLKRLHRS